ncbi:hypothetical protein ACHAPO_003809 [Fusarium lateritium]
MADHGNEKRPDSGVEPASSQTATLAVTGEEKNIISEASNRDEKTLSGFGADDRTPNDDNALDEGEGDAESVDSKDELKLSKGRCIALVCTVTGASFLNGAAANVPTAIGILGTTFPPGKAKNYAFSAYAAGAPLGSVCGNLVSGLIAQWASWKWVFGALAIMAGMIAVAGVFCIPPSPPELRPEHTSLRAKTAAVDWIGATLITCGLLALTFALTEGNVVGWTVPWIPVLIVVSLGIIVAFFFWQRYLEQKTNRPPLVKVSIFNNWRFTAVMIIMGFFFGGFNNYLIYATYYFQDYQGLSPLQTMLRFIPTGVSGFIVAFCTAYLLSRIPTFFILAFGHVAVCIAALLYAVPIPPTTSYFAWGMWAMILSVVGADTAWPCLTLFTSHALPREDQTVGGALINSSGMIGRAISLAVATAIQSSVMAKARGVDVQHVGPVEEWDAPSLKGLRAGAWTNFGILFMALALVVYTFRSMEIIGKLPERPQRAEGIVNQQDADVERRA